MGGIALPSVGGSAGFGRFAINAAGAGVGVLVASNFIVPKLPSAFFQDWVGDFGGTDVVYGACALLGAMLANSIYNRIAD